MHKAIASMQPHAKAATPRASSGCSADVLRIHSRHRIDAMDSRLLLTRGKKAHIMTGDGSYRATAPSRTKHDGSTVPTEAAVTTADGEPSDGNQDYIGQEGYLGEARTGLDGRRRAGIVLLPN